jgi:hypothetical protein
MKKYQWCSPIGQGRTSMKKLASTTLWLFLFAASATAQTERSAFITGYASGYFTSQHPSSAFEMVGLLPGFQLTEGDNKLRGYGGSVGNVLIDGRPPTSKQETLETILRRITPDSIARIEVVRSGAPGFDFQGFPLLANVVLKPNNAPRGQVSAENAFFRHGHTNTTFTGGISWGATDVLDLTVTASRKGPDSNAGFGIRDYYSPTGAVTERDRYTINRNDNVWNITGGYRQPLLGGLVRFTGLYNELRTKAPLLAVEYFPIQSTQPGGDTEFKTDSEIGLQYNHKLWSASEIETNLLRRAETYHHFQTAFVGAEKDLSSQHAHSSETISHSVFRTQDGSISFEGALDATLNQLENTVDLFKNTVKIPLPVASVHLTEQRGEGTATVTWQADPSLTLEGGLRYEIARLKQTGGSVLTKTFGYWKPRLKASYKLDKENTLRFLVEREAGQLNFNNFITTVEVKVNSVNGGNKDLVPQTLWQAEVNWEHTLPGGSFVLTARHQLISNTQDNIALVGVGGLYNALGNIGYGRNTEFQASLVTPVPFLWSGLTFQASTTYHFSSVKDSPTRKRRMISQGQAAPWIGKISLTQDLPEWNARLGASYQWPTGTNIWRYNEYRIMHSQALQTDMFVEYKPTPVWLVRLYARNILDTKNLNERYIYAGPRNTSPFVTLEDRRTTFGPQVGFFVQRSFGQ